jgi:uncharacterized protein YdhG (YjbR/CyaY superfamily)
MIPPINSSNYRNGARLGFSKLYSASFPDSTAFHFKLSPIEPLMAWTSLVPSDTLTPMKKPGSRKRISAAKSRPTSAPKTIDAYLSSVPEPAQSTLQKVRAAIRAALPPSATETISYKIPAFRHGQIVIWFAAFANHCSLFPTSRIIELFKGQLKPYTLSKGTIQFPTNKPLPAALIKKMVKARLTQLAAKKRH